VRSLRRILAILALAIAYSVAATGRADAHVCATPVSIPLDRSATVTVGVPAEERAVTHVDVGLPAGFRLARVTGAQFWTGQRMGDVVRFQGGPLAPYACGFFSLTGTATEKGKLVFPLTLQLEDGSTLRYTGTKINDPLGAQLVFAGTEPKASDYFGDTGGGSSRSGLGVAGWVLVGLGTAGIVGAVVVRRYVITAPPRSPGQQPATRGRGPRASGSSRRRSRTLRPSRRS
jgi:hypothetical protein